MILDNCYAFGLLLLYFDLKKKFLGEGVAHWPMFSPLWIRPWADMVEQHKCIYEGQSKISESCFISDKLLLVWVVFV